MITRFIKLLDRKGIAPLEFFRVVLYMSVLSAIVAFLAVGAILSL